MMEYCSKDSKMCFFFFVESGDKQSIFVFSYNTITTKECYKFYKILKIFKHFFKR
jgi:hypothetical protein